MDLQAELLAFSLLGVEWVLWLLVFMSVLCVIVTVERIAYFTLNKSSKAGLQESLTKYLKGGDKQVFQSELDEMGGIEARVLAAGLDASSNGADSAEEVIAGTMVFERSKADRGLIIVGTVGSNAPFIGLFGTVLGIITAFNDLASQAAEATDAVMSGISEALVATAIGLLVAIPAVVMYNYLQRRVKAIFANTTSLSHLVLARLKSKEA
jgi:biopolymer transport protein ExbB